MTTRPEIFVSAASRDLKSCRQLVRDALLTLGCVPIVQDHFAPGADEVRVMLRERIAVCDAVIHLAGQCYGHEPHERAPADPRRSYAQLEYDVARELKKPLYTFLCAPDFPYDAHAAEPEDLRQLQQAHREALVAGDGMCLHIKDPCELSMHIRELQTRVDCCHRDRPIRRRSTDGEDLVHVSMAGTLPVPEHVPTGDFLAAAGPALDDAPSLLPSYENVQFTAYRPKVVRPGKWEKLLVFAHLDERPDWMDADDLAPMEEVEAQAAALLGPKAATYRHTTDDSRLAIPRDGEITLIPELSGFDFNPPRRSFFWKDGVAVHGETFEMRADPATDGQTARGRLTIFLGALILADIGLVIRVDGRAAVAPSKSGPAIPVTVRPFRRIFASYSHRDLAIVETMERHARSLGDEYLRDWVHLRSGEQWDERLRALVAEADVFQLFWSGNAARSEFVEREWRYALELRREAFVRPTYWQEPMPTPPEALASIHFHRLGFETTAPALAPSPAPNIPAKSGLPTRVPKVPAKTVPPAEKMAGMASAPASPHPSRRRRSVAAPGLLTALLVMTTLFLYQKKSDYTGRSTRPATSMSDDPRTASAPLPTAVVQDPPAVGAVDRPNFELENDATAKTRRDVLARIGLTPLLTDAQKAMLTGIVDRARGLSCVFVVPINASKTALDPGTSDILVHGFKSAGIQNLLEDPTIVFLVLGYADQLGGAAANEKAAMDRAENVLGVMRDRCGVQNVMYAVGMGGPTPFDGKSAIKDRLVEIWAVAP